MATIDQQFVEYIVKTLVNNPDKVVVERTIDEKGVLLSLTVDGEDVGRVIGRRGVTAQSIRTLLRALGTKNDARYNLKIVNTDGETRAPKAEAKPSENTETPEAAHAAALLVVRADVDGGFLCGQRFSGLIDSGKRVIGFILAENPFVHPGLDARGIVQIDGSVNGRVANIAGIVGNIRFRTGHARKHQTCQ